MKEILVLLFFLYTSSAWGQQVAPLPLDTATHRITYASEVPLAGVSRPEILARADYWYGVTARLDYPYKSSPGTREVLARGHLLLIYSVAGNRTTVSLGYVISVSIGNEGYRYELTDLAFDYPTGAIPAETLLTNATQQTNEAEDSLALRTSFEEAIGELLTKLHNTMDKPLGKVRATN